MHGRGHHGGYGGYGGHGGHGGFHNDFEFWGSGPHHHHGYYNNYGYYPVSPVTTVATMAAETALFGAVAANSMNQPQTTVVYTTPAYPQMVQQPVYGVGPVVQQPVYTYAPSAPPSQVGFFSQQQNGAGAPSQPAPQPSRGYRAGY